MKTPPEKTNNKRTKQSKTKGYKDERLNTNEIIND
jgi:hypothetical protein